MPAEDIQKIFIATTSEAYEKDWLREVLTTVNESVRANYPYVELEPWTTSFGDGDITAERLIEISSEVIAAVVVLTADDWTESRGETYTAPRDNLIFEAGLFIGQLGLHHVLLLREVGSKWPTDLYGVTAKAFSQPPEGRKGTTAIAANGIALGIEQFLRGLAKIDGSAAGRALRKSSMRVILEAHDLRSSLTVVPTDEPIIISDPKAAYLDAVSQVEGQFATTTYLESEFWTSSELSVVDANKELLDRVKKKGGTARRLILLDRPVEQELERQRRRRRLLRSGDHHGVDEMNREHEHFASANRELIEQGFEVKVVYDQAETHLRLPRLKWAEGQKIELALYDRARVDVFSGFTSGERAQVAAYVEGGFSRFRTLQGQVQRYFDNLWLADAALDFAIFGERMDMIIGEVEREIIYIRHWLMYYDKNHGDDGDLKEDECKFVRDRLALRYGVNGARASSHVDVGTCTGRYLKELACFFADDRRIVGVDNDPECIRMLMQKVAEKELAEEIEILQGDFRYKEDLPHGKFDIVTCLMGTLCHLGRDEGSSEYRDEWQAGLENLASLLSPDGDLFIAVWDKRGCDQEGGQNHLLNIYEPASVELVCEQTPSTAELARRLAQAGLAIEDSKMLRRRLHVYHLQHAR